MHAVRRRISSGNDGRRSRQYGVERLMAYAWLLTPPEHPKKGGGGGGGGGGGWWVVGGPDTLFQASVR